MIKQITNLHYTIDNKGNVDYINKEWASVYKYRIGYLTKNNLKYVRLYNPKFNRKTNFSISTLVASHFIDNPDNYRYVIHLDGDRYNNNVENLKWGSWNDIKIFNKEFKEKTSSSEETIKQDNTTTEESDSEEESRPRGKLSWIPKGVKITYVNDTSDLDWYLNEQFYK